MLESVTGFHVHRGILASFHRRPCPLEELLAGARRLAVLEGLNTHTNLGALFRSAAALGIDAVVLSPNCADPLYRRAVRVSMGEVFAIPYAKPDDDWPARSRGIRDGRFHPARDDPGRRAVALQDSPAAHRERPGLMLGAEGPGLTRRRWTRRDVRRRHPDAQRRRLAERGDGGRHRVLGAESRGGTS